MIYIEILIIVILLIVGFYVGWNIGANDAANCIGTSVGAGIISYKRAVILMSIFVVLGAVFQGQHVMKTIGKGIVLSSEETFINAYLPKEISAADFEKNILNKFETIEEKDIFLNAYKEKSNIYKLSKINLDEKKVIYNKLSGLNYQGIQPIPADFNKHFSENRLSDIAIFSALLAAGIFVTIATFASVPVSTSQSIVGGVAGVGIGIVGFNSAYFDISVMTKIVVCWITNPILSIMMSFPLYLILKFFLKRVKNQYRWNKILTILVIVSACYVSFSLGSNDVGNAVGPLYNKFENSGVKNIGQWLGLFGGIALGIGAITFGKRVVQTVGKEITPLDLPGAFIAQISSATGVYFFTLLGVPVSTSQSIVGSIIGVGLAKGIKSVSAKKIGRIVIGWILTPTCAAIFGAILYKTVYFLTSLFI